MTLDEFVAQSRPKFEQGFSSNSYVEEPGFLTLYVRLAYHLIGGEKHRCIDIANVEVAQRSQGTFKALVARLRARYPEFTIYVESVMNARFGPGLLRMGFKVVPGGYEYAARSYYLPPV